MGRDNAEEDVASKYSDDDLERMMETQEAGAEIPPVDLTPAEIDELLEQQLGPRVTDDLLAATTDGAEWLLGESEEVTAIWGDAEQCAWAAGEGLMIAGGQGVGKSTIAQQLALARMGLRNEVLGLPVQEGVGTTLYIAGDRPRQAQRSMRRMVDNSMEDVLRRRLRVWRGPLPADVVERPLILKEMAEYCGADTIIVDSVKDIAADLSSEQTGSMVNRAVQYCVAVDRQVLELHHQRKEGQQGKSTNSIDSIYGSTWITSGLGSVFFIAGKPGDSHVTLKHLKQPAEEVGPLKVVHDHATGQSTLNEELDPLEIVRRTPGGADSATVAMALFGVAEKNDVERARTKLKKLEDSGALTKEAHKRPDGSAKPRHVYSAVEGQTPRGRGAPRTPEFHGDLF